MRGLRDRLSHIGLRKRTFIYVGAGLMALIVLLYMASLQTINQGVEMISQQKLTLTENVAQHVDVLVQHLHAEMSLASSTIDGSRQGGTIISDNKEPMVSVRKRLQNHLMAFHGIDVTVSVALLDAQGKVLQTEPSLEQKNGSSLAYLPSVSSVLRDEQIYTEVEEAILTGDRPTLSLVAPIKDEQEFAGALLVADIPVTHGTFDLVLRRWGAEHHLELVNRNGLVLASSVPEKGTALTPHWGLIHPLVEERLPGIREHKGDGEEGQHIVVFVPLKQVPWGIVLEEPNELILGLPWTLGQRILMTGGLAVLVAAALIWGFTRQVLSPIRRLATVAEQIGAGDLEARVPEMGRDEIGALAQRFETMRLQLKHSLDETNRWNQELEERVKGRTVELDTLHMQLRQRDEERSNLLAKIIAAQEEERRRVARELHDDISQTLAGLVLSLGSAEAVMGRDPVVARQTLESSRHLASEAVENVRRLIRGLRPSLLDDLGMVPAISWYVENYLAPTGVEAKLEISGIVERQASSVEIALFRVVQESITNTVKHARAKTVRIALQFVSSAIIGDIEDDGRGFNMDMVRRDKGEGMGLLGMGERIELLGGKLTIESQQGKGTHVHFEVPKATSRG
jgi:signal transduction histidine kinase